MIDVIIPALLKKNNVAILGGGGVGKTYLTKRIISILTELKISVGVTASTGLAATHLEGMTVHRFTGIGGYSNQKDFFKLYHSRSWSEIKIRLSVTDILIIDEISMLRCDTFDFLNYVCKMARGKPNLPFGGLQIMVVGDFLQLPPVVREKDYFPRPWAFQSEAWKEGNFKICYLTVVKRQEDKLFVDMLNNMRYGKISKEGNDLIQSRIDVKLPDSECEPIRLMSLNKVVKKYNDERIEAMPGQFVMSGAKYGYREPKDWYALKNEVNAEEVLSLKPGCQVIITANDSNGAYVNGSMGIFNRVIENDGEGSSQMERLFSKLSITLNNGNEVIVPMKKWTLMDEDIPEKVYEHYNDLIIREQYNEAESFIRQYQRGWFIQWPVRLAYAITIHKSQGMTLDKMEFHGKQIFSDAQAYVGLSRARSLDGLSIKDWNPRNVRANQAAIEFYNSLLGQKS